MYSYLRGWFLIALVIFVFALFPKFASAETYIEADIITDTTWSLSGSPYIVSGPRSITENSTLTITPGVIVKFLDASSSLYISGSLHAQGTQAEPIFFTSYQDDIGGDTNQDNEDSLPYPGDWDGLIFGDYTDSSTTLSNIHFRYSENGIMLVGVDIDAEDVICSYSNQCFNLAIDANLSMKNFIADHVSGNIFDLYQSSLTLKDAVVSNVEIGLNPFSQHILDGYKSAVSFENVNIQDMPTPVGGISLFGQSSFLVSGFQFTSQSDKDAITIFNDSNISLRDVFIKKVGEPAGESGVVIFNSVDAVLSHVRISGFGDTGLYDLGSQSEFTPNTLVLDHIEIDHNSTGLGIVSSSLAVSINGVSLHDNGYSAFYYKPEPISLQNIWWGSSAGPNVVTQPTGTNNELFGVGPINYTPWATEDPFNLEPAEYFAKITNIPGGVAKLYETPSINGVLVKTLPNDWIVKVIQKTLDSGQPAISDGYRWYKVEDPTDGSQMWMFAGSGTGENAPFLPYKPEEQNNYQQIGAEFINSDPTKNSKNSFNIIQANKRRQVVVESIDHYLANNDSAPSLNSSNDKINISTLLTQGFSREILLAIVAQESGLVLSYHTAVYDNEYVSYDYGHGIMQITPDAYGNEAPSHNFINNKEDPRGRYSDVTLRKCKETSSLISSRSNIGSDQYKKCYQNTDTYNEKLKPYDNYDHNLSNVKYKQYANTVQSMNANIKDGLGILESKYGHVYPHACNKPITINGVVFSCNDLSRIKAIWGYNGATLVSKKDYLNLVSIRLKNLPSYFPGYSYENTDQFVEKLEVANNHRIELKKHSPVTIQIIDSQGNVTGEGHQGDITNDIPNSYYDSENGAALILFPQDTYSYRVVGDGTGPSYGLDIVSVDGPDREITFQAIGLPITAGEIHTYRVNEAALEAGENDAVTVDIDKNGDGTPEETITTGATLTDVTSPVVNLNSLQEEYSLGEKIDLKILVTDNVSKSSKVEITAAWDGAPLPVTNGKVILPSIGDHMLSITVKDEAGNSATFTKDIHVSYAFLGFRPATFDGGSFKKNKPLPIKFRIRAKNGILIPLLHPTLSVVRVSDGFHTPVNPNLMDEDPDCDVEDECFRNYHNRYRKILPANTLTVGQWIITVGLDDGYMYTATINMTN